jgi:hypothetical protein
MKQYTIDDIKTIIAQAKVAAENASQKYLTEKMNGEDNYPCGFAWVDILGIKGNTKMGRALKAAGIEKSYNGSYQIWNPGGLHVQNVDVKTAGAEAAAGIFELYGFRASAGDRLD